MQEQDDEAYEEEVNTVTTPGKAGRRCTTWLATSCSLPSWCIQPPSYTSVWPASCTRWQAQAFS